MRRSTVVDEVCRCHARPAERSGLLARSPREIISTCWSHPSTASAPTSHDVHEGGWTSERLWSIRCTGRLCSHCGWQSDPARSTASQRATLTGRVAPESPMLTVRASLSVRPVPWTCDLDRTSRSCRVFCSLQCMACVHWSTQATAAALVHRQMAMRPLWRRQTLKKAIAIGQAFELTYTFWEKRPPLLVTTP